MTRNRSTAPPISNGALNRATLARQGLLERQEMSIEAMLGHLIGLQGQVHRAPYLGLWSRLSGFRIAELEALLTGRRAVRATMMRVTLHVALADDFLGLRPLFQATAMRVFKTNHLAALKGADLDEVRAAGRKLLDAGALTPACLGQRLQERWPDVAPIDLSMPARFLDPVVHVPPAGLFNATGAPELTSARRWLGRDPMPIASAALALRYLAAFGPATGRDFNAWSGLTGGAALFETLRPQLVSFTGEDGRELFDLPGAPRPAESAEALPRLLPEYDNVLLGHADRSRILSPAAWKGLWRANGLRPAFTVDGVVAGSWKLTLGQEACVALAPFVPLRRRDEAALRREARALLATIAPERPAEIVFTPPA